MTGAVLHYDAEVFSEKDVTSVGVYRYSECPSTELLCLAYRFDDGPVTLWIPREFLPPEIIPAVLQRLADKAAAAEGRTLPARILTGTKIVVSETAPDDIRDHIRAGKETRAYNHQYERVTLNGAAGQRVFFPRVEIKQTACVAAMTAAAGLPRALKDSCEALEVYPKDESGRFAMLRVTKPRKPTKDDPSTRWTPENAPDDFIALYMYVIDDVLAECDVDKVVPDLTPYEQEVYWLDQRINERGIQADIESIHNVIALREEYKTFLTLAMEKATRPVFGEFDFCPACNGTKKVEKILRKKPTGIFLTCEACSGFKPTQGEKIANWIRANGYPALLDMQAETVKDLVKQPDVPQNVKHALRIYSTFNAKATTKFDSILDSVCADGRVRGMFIYHGANTGRWSSVIVQFQNLLRPVIDDPETAIKAFSTRNLEWIKTIYSDVDPMKVFGSTVRGHLLAAPGKKLVCPDLAGIESRKNAWLWNEEWKLRAFRDYDAGKGPGIYEIVYCQSFGGDPRKVAKNSFERKVGKTEDLSMQYEGGFGAFVTQADTYGVDLYELAERVYPTLDEETLDRAAWMWKKFGGGCEYPERVYMAVDGVKQKWRGAHPNTVQGWKDLKSAAELAVQHPGQMYPVAGGRGIFKVMTNDYGHSWLCLLLPSRRRMIRYFKPEWTPEQTVIVAEKNKYTGAMEEVEKVIPGELHYMGIDTHTRRYMRTSTYGGMLNNNFVQGSSADLLRNGMFALEGGGYAIVLTVHDEAGAEVDELFGSAAEAERLICRREDWFEGLPMAAEGWAGKRYRK